MNTQQLQARALGDPTRHAIFRYLADQKHLVDVAELTRHVGLHHNAIRQHLARLVTAELVVESTGEARGRGRPRLLYTVAANVDSRWGVVGPYERLSLLLTEIIRTGDSPVEVGARAGAAVDPGAGQNADPTGNRTGDPTGNRTGERTGNGTGERTGNGTGNDAPADALLDHMARLGFDPTLTRNGDRLDLILRKCPHAATAVADPDTVCGLHLGIARGIAGAQPGLVVDDLIRNDPREAHCILRCHVEVDNDHVVPATSG